MNLELSAFFLSLLCLVYSLTARRRQYHLPGDLKSILLSQHVLFLSLLVCTMLSSESSVGGELLKPYASSDVVFYQYLLHFVYFFFHNALSVSFALYIMNLNGASVGRSRRFYLLFALPFLCAQLLVLTNAFTGLVFYMDEEFIYHRGVLMPVLYVSGLLYLMMGFVSFYRHKQAVTRADSMAVGILLAITFLGVAVQGLWSELQVELFAEAVTFLGLMVIIEERSGHVDPVTGILNRVAFVDTNRRLLEIGQPYRIVMIRLTDLDLFGRFFSGREMDRLILLVSEWLISMTSEQSLYCIRNHDFAICLSDTPDEACLAMADSIVERFGQDWKTGKAVLRLEAVVSLIRVPEDVSALGELEELLASEQPKAGLGSRLIPFQEFSARLRNRKIEQALREAVELKHLQTWYQPIWSVDQQRTVAAEALVRINSGPLRKMSPEEYIPIAEQCGLIREIGLFVFEEVCRFLRDNRVQSHLAYIELNLSVYQFLYDDDLAERLEEIRARYDVAHEMLNLEITESASTGENPAVRHTMEALRAMGYTLSLDDFGTGYSNLAQFISSSYKNIKMDKSLLLNSECNESAAQLLDSMIRVIRSLGYNVVQEGVETPAQLDRAIASGGNLIQGYYFSPPLPEHDFIAYLAQEEKVRI